MKRRSLGSAVFGSALLALSVLAPSLVPTEARADAVTHEASTPLFKTPSGEAFQRVYMGWGVLSIPSYFTPVNGKYDLMVHFHGGQQLQEENVDLAHMNVIIVSINLGISSSAYGDMGGSPGSLDRILERTQSQLEKTELFKGPAKGAKVGKIAVTAWSAGFAAVAGMLSQPSAVQKIDAVILADAPHCSWTGYKQIYTPSLEKYAAFAQLAMKGDKLMVITHSAIGVEGYASTTETVTELLRMMNLTKIPHPTEGPRKMQEIYEVNAGNFHVKGFEGTQKEDHIDHIKGMYALDLPYLKARWEK